MHKGNEAALSSPLTVDFLGSTISPAVSSESATVSRRPDVTVLVYDFRASGVVRNALRIAERLAVAGLRCDVVVVHNNGVFEPTNHPLLRFMALRTGSSPSRALGIVSAIQPLRAYLRENQPRVLFSAGNHIHPLAAVACHGLDNPPRLIMRASNDVSHARRGGWEATAANILRSIARPALRAMFARADRIVSVSSELAKDMAQQLGLPGSRIQVVTNGIDVAHVARLASEPLDHPWFASGEPPVIIGMGRLVRQKNFPLLIRAFAELRRQRPARLMIIGAGSHTARRSLINLAAGLGVGQDVALIGYVENPFAYLHRAALFVLSSSWEGMSNALLEALACGCPVVATRCPTGTVEILEGGRHGPLVEIENVGELSKAMTWRLSQPRQSARLTARAQAYDLSRTLDSYVQILSAEARLLEPQRQQPLQAAA